MLESDFARPSAMPALVERYGVCYLGGVDFECCSGPFARPRRRRTLPYPACPDPVKLMPVVWIDRYAVTYRRTLLAVDALSGRVRVAPDCSIRG